MQESVEIDRLSHRSLEKNRVKEWKKDDNMQKNYFSSGKIVCLYAQLLADIPGVLEPKGIFSVHRMYFALIACVLNRKLLEEKHVRRKN